MYYLNLFVTVDHPTLGVNSNMWLLVEMRELPHTHEKLDKLETWLAGLIYKEAHRKQAHINFLAVSVVGFQRASDGERDTKEADEVFGSGCHVVPAWNDLPLPH